MKKEIFHSGAKFNWEALLIVYTTSKWPYSKWRLR
jgi:hypothetical protein